jgi:transcriptional regulator with XRE-family HTH domain
MTQAKLAEEIGKSVPYISHIETATKQASLSTLVSIANALGVTVDTFLLGNQSNDLAEYRSELICLVDDCNSDERCFIYEMASAAKSSLRKKGWLPTNSKRI